MKINYSQNRRAIWGRKDYWAHVEERRNYAREQHKKHRVEQTLARRKSYYKNHEKRLAEMRLYYHNKRRDKYLQNKYGITLKDYNKMFKAQNGVCAVCGRPPKNRNLDLDHNHKTGAIRGLLCPICNKLLVSKHTVDTAKKVFTYLRNRDDGKWFKNL